MSLNDGDESVFDNDSARRIADVVRTVERTSAGRTPDRYAPMIVPYKKVCKLTTALTARAGSTPGHGTVQPYLITPTSIASHGVPVTIYNWTGTAVASGLGVKFEVIDGYLWFDGEDCSGVAFP